jgi:hypothetical protein
MESKKKSSSKPNIKNVAKKSATVKVALSKEQVDQKVRETAYYKWQNAGQPQGRDAEFWAAAEVEVRQG